MPSGIGMGGRQVFFVSAFMFKEPALAWQPSAVTGQRTVGANHSMAGNDDRNGVRPIGGATALLAKGRPMARQCLRNCLSFQAELPARPSKLLAGTMCRRLRLEQRPMAQITVEIAIERTNDRPRRLVFVQRELTVVFAQ